jgi:hypothetical protein
MTIIDVFQSHDQNIVVLVEGMFHSFLHFVYHVIVFNRSQCLSSFLKSGTTCASFQFCGTTLGVLSDVWYNSVRIGAS